MYFVSKFKDHQVMAISVPPEAHNDLDDDFRELSRIHFYLGHLPIEHMIEAVEKASLKDIERGKIQLYFAVKEIQEFLRGVWNDLSVMSQDNLDPAIYFNKTFESILSHVEDVLDKVFSSPKKKNNVEMINTMLGLSHEVLFLNDELNKSGIKTKDISEFCNNIKNKYQKVYGLKSNYENLSELKTFEAYAEDAKKSVLNQLVEPYEFNYTDLANIYMPCDGDWVYTYIRMKEALKKIDENPNYEFNEKESAKLKENFLKQIKGFNRLLKNGVVNYIYSYAATLSNEAFFNVNKSQISAESYFEREVGYHQDRISKKNNYYVDKKYHQEKIKELNSIKDEYIAKKMDDQTFREKYLTLLHRQETNIYQSLNKVKANVLNIAQRDTLVFEGDINEGFVIGKFNNSDKVLLAHKDNTVNSHEAIYAMILDKDKYDELVRDNKLVFSLEFKDMEFVGASNFWNYGQFLQEISSPNIQKVFLGQEFDLVDKTVIKDYEKKKLKV